MKTIKILGIVVIAGIIMTFGSEIGERLSVPENSEFGADCRSQSRASANPRERCRGGAALGAALCGWRV